MARKDLPFLKLYVQDLLTDEKLMECSAQAHGVYLRLLCILFKCTPRGKILLKQKDKQSDNQIENFALKLAKHMPFSVDVISAGLTGLIDEKVVNFNISTLTQKRMYEDGLLSEIRSQSGSNGGKTTQKNNKKFAKAKTQASAEYEYEYICIISFERFKENFSFLEYTEFEFMLVQEMMKIWMEHFPEYAAEIENDFPACLQISKSIALNKKWKHAELTNGKLSECLSEWRKLVLFIHSDDYFSSFTVTAIKNNYQKVKAAQHGSERKRDTNFGRSNKTTISANAPETSL